MIQSAQPFGHYHLGVQLQCSHKRISIHASRMGCDTPAGAFGWGMTSFQSTHPVWDATAESVTCQGCHRISIHASRMGCDMIRRATVGLGLISIHASRMGCDGTQAAVRVQPRHFNPRIPYGMRPNGDPQAGDILLFQSTHPVWDATKSDQALDQYPSISIHASRMGCDDFPR